MKRKLTLALGEIGKLLGAKWKELDDSEKKVSVIHLRCSLACHQSPCAFRAQHACTCLMSDARYAVSALVELNRVVRAAMQTSCF